MILSHRPYTDADLPAVQTALASWIQAAGDCGLCHVGELPDYIYRLLCGKPQEQLVRIWQIGADIVGISISHLFDNAFAVYVRPEERGSDGEIVMLETAAEIPRRSIRQQGGEETSVIIDVWDQDEIRQAQLRRIGFVEYRQWGYLTERRLSAPIPDPHLPRGFTIRSATPDDAERYIAAYNAAFQGTWRVQDYRDCVMLKPGYHPDHVRAVIAPDGRFASFTILWFDEINHVGLFEPVGTHPDFQRRGLARSLMLHCLHDMRRRGMETVKVGYDATHDAADRLYRGIGFERKYATLGYRRS